VPDRTALVEVPSGVPPPDPALQAPPDSSSAGQRHHIEILDMAPGEVRVRVGSEADGLLIHGSNMASGWTATVDGDPAPVYRTNGFLQGVVVPAGSHVVRFRYLPVSFALGAILSIVGLALVASVLVRPELPGWAIPSRGVRSA
jgi:hypothetical protein